MLPVTTDRDTAPFFQALAQGRLSHAACPACARAVHPPMPYCPDCPGEKVIWRTVAPTGRVIASSVCHTGFHPAFAVPYTNVMVELVEAPGVILSGLLPGEAAVSAGTMLKAVFPVAGSQGAVLEWQVSCG